MKAGLLVIFLLFFSQEKAFALDCETQKILSTYQPRFAKLFTIKYFEHFKVIESHTDKFIVTDKKLNCSTSLPLIKLNTERVIATSTTHLSFLNFFHLEKKLVGFQGVNYIYNSSYDKKSLKDISFDLNPEELISLKPDLIVAYSENLRRPERLNELRKLALPIVLNHDLEEKHPLARAEWIVFMSVFFGKDKEAITFFNEIALNYEKLQKEVSRLVSKNILVGDIQNGHWATCGSSSDLALLIRDAGGILALENVSDKSSKTQFISLEKALILKNFPVLWLSQNTWTSKKMINSDSRYQKFKNLKIFNNIKKLNAQGFNDFWENGLARPDLLLLDLVKIIHPEKYPQIDLVWYKELQ